MIPESQVSLRVPIPNLLDLPDGAGYTKKSGRASFNLQRQGDDVIITSKCDSIARENTYYRQELFRLQDMTDSLQQVISQMNVSSSRTDESHKLSEEKEQSIKETPPSAWYKWLLGGFVLGLISVYPLKKIKTEILTLIK